MTPSAIHVYAAFLALWMVLLALRVIALRGNPIFAFLSFGPKTNDRLERAIRGHGNLTEYAPLFLILLYLAQSSGAKEAFLHGLGMAFCLGRVLHGTLFCFLTKPSIPLRVSGMTLTLFPILFLAISLLRSL